MKQFENLIFMAAAAAAAKKWFLYYWLVLIFHFTTFSNSTDTITTTQSFKQGDLLVSKGNKFAFGFFSPRNGSGSSTSSSRTYLGIWFHQISEKSVVWVANRNHPIIGFSAVLSINQYGNLALHNDPDQKVKLWSTNVTENVTDSCVAQLLDSGNLVLLQVTSKRVVWQSFDYPTDTMMPGMRFGQNLKAGNQWYLTSWRAADDPGTGDYSFKLSPVGLPQFILYKGSIPLWRNHLWPTRKFSDVYNFSYVVNQDLVYTVYYMNDPSVILRIMVDHLGFFKWITWHEKDGQWKEFMSVPKYPCDNYAKCGAYGVCSPSNPPLFECSCLPGYEPKSPNAWYLRDASQGCVRKRLRSSSVCRHGEGFVKVKNVKFSETSNAAWVGKNMRRMECEQECLRNCSCSAYSALEKDVKETGCFVWYGELIDIVDNMRDDLDVYVRVDAVELAENTRKSSSFGGKEQRILVLSICVAWFSIFFFVYLWLRRKRKKGKNKRGDRVANPSSSSSIYYRNPSLAAIELGENAGSQDISIFDLSSIVAATNNFSPANKLGQGGFGSVYRGQLANGQEIAVKRLSKNSRQGLEEFKNEVSLISKLQHKNLVRLLGCCIHKQEKMLIYEYLPNKSLDFFIFGLILYATEKERRPLLDWRKRFEIIHGVARGLLYLHQDSRLKIIHRDLKASNVLLDAAMNPKISDFGMARMFGEDQIEANTNRIVGTYGYMSPEYAMDGLYSTKSDVFSFGVLTLEIISGRKNNDCHDNESPSSNLVGNAWDLWRDEKVLDIVDSEIEQSYPRNEVLKCIQIGLLCVQECPSDRPTMVAVVSLLSNETTLPSPKKPAFIFKRRPSDLALSAAAGVTPSSNDVTITTLEAR